MLLGGEEGLEFESHGNGAQLEQVSELKYLGCGFGELGTYHAVCSRKVASGRKDVGAG